MRGNPTDTLDAYQHEAMRTVPADFENALAVFALGVAGEAGEVADLVKKHVGHGHDLDKEKLAKELGDVLWYVATLAHRIGLSLSDVAAGNVEKLRKRYPAGFSTEASKARVDQVSTGHRIWDARRGAEGEPTPEQVAEWNDPDLAYERVFGRPRTENLRAWAILIDSADYPEAYPPRLPEETDAAFARRVLASRDVP